MRTMRNEAQVVETLEEVFGLKPPVDFLQLKSLYRTKCKQLHPDVGGTEADFRKLNEAFMVLKEFYEVGSPIFNFQNGDNGEYLMNPKSTVNGVLLSNLGLGLGPNENGIDCERCECKGFILEKQYGRRSICTECKGSGIEPKKVVCRPCYGSGKFKQVNGSIVDCRKCKGTGKFKHPYLETFCQKCVGAGSLYDQVSSILAYECFKCEGKGQIKIHNPVIPKGRLAGLMRMREGLEE